MIKVNSGEITEESCQSGESDESQFRKQIAVNPGQTDGQRCLHICVIIFIKIICGSDKRPGKTGLFFNY